MRTVVAMLGSIAVACGTDHGKSYQDDPTDPELPARGETALRSWLAAGYYKSWKCEPAPRAGRTPSPHGIARVCNNHALATSSVGELPVGVAAVKEILDPDNSIHGYAVSRKIAAGVSGSSWYWFEATADTVYADGENEATCVGCHSGAARELVFTFVP